VTSVIPPTVIFFGNYTTELTAGCLKGFIFLAEFIPTVEWSGITTA
jgi:hypothetical protein